MSPLLSARPSEDGFDSYSIHRKSGIQSNSRTLPFDYPTVWLSNGRVLLAFLFSDTSPEASSDIKTPSSVNNTFYWHLLKGPLLFQMSVNCCMLCRNPAMSKTTFGKTSFENVWSPHFTDLKRRQCLADFWSRSIDRACHFFLLAKGAWMLPLLDSEVNKKKCVVTRGLSFWVAW